MKTPSHKIGSTYPFGLIRAAYGADEPSDSKPPYLLYCGDEIVALCLRYNLNPKAGEVWIGNEAGIAASGQQLAALKDKKSLPLYYSPRGRTFYEFKGHHSIINDTTDAKELEQRKGSVPLSRIVFISPLKIAAR